MYSRAQRARLLLPHAREASSWDAKRARDGCLPSHTPAQHTAAYNFRAAQISPVPARKRTSPPFSPNPPPKRVCAATETLIPAAAPTRREGRGSWASLPRHQCGETGATHSAAILTDPTTTGGSTKTQASWVGHARRCLRHSHADRPLLAVSLSAPQWVGREGHGLILRRGCGVREKVPSSFQHSIDELGKTRPTNRLTDDTTP